MLNLIFLLVTSLFSQAGEHHLSRFPLPSTDPSNFTGVAVDLYIDGTHLYQLENREHRLLKIELGDRLGDITVLAEKGDGPGDLFAPLRVSGVPGSGLVIVDVRGISLFNEDGIFLRRLKKFTPTISIAATEAFVFHATANPRNRFLIEAMNWEGERETSFLDRWVDIESASGSNRKHSSHLSYMHSGFLLTDGRYLYFLNTTFLRFLKLDLRGNIIHDKNMSDAFGPKGLANIEENRNYLDRPALMEEKSGYYVFLLFQDAYLHQGKIYLIRTDEPDLDLASEEKELFVLDAEDFALLDRFTFRVARGERVHAMAIRNFEGRPQVVLNMETNDDADVRIIVLKP